LSLNVPEKMKYLQILPANKQEIQRRQQRRICHLTTRVNRVINRDFFQTRKLQTRQTITQTPEKIHLINECILSIITIISLDDPRRLKWNT